MADFKIDSVKIIFLQLNSYGDSVKPFNPSFQVEDAPSKVSVVFGRCRGGKVFVKALRFEV